ncbi:hypothetical protein [Clostridium sp. DL1XJH146]
MDTEKKQREFQKRVVYKKIGFSTWFFAIIPMIFIEGAFKYAITIIICAIAIYFERQYKCPYCNKVFDPRLKSSELTYCPKCNEKLQ